MSPILLTFAGSLFVSAFLLFLVQPMIGKMILPRLGGTPQVWNTCMVFFQTALLAGYAYTHTLSTRLKTRQQILVHGVMLFIPFAILFMYGRPFNVVAFGTPPWGANPIPWTLGLLTVVVGLPFFVVSTTAPLLQRWFAETGDPAARDPYFLYAASNAGSLAALIFYPAVMEWALLLGQQAWTWAIGYAVFVALVLFCGFVVLRSPGHAQLAAVGGPTPRPDNPTPAPAPEAPKETGIKKPVGKGGRQRFGKGVSTAPSARKEEHKPLEDVSLGRLQEVTWLRRLRWIGLAAVPSSLMLGVTTYITTDLSPIPLFWLIPLTLYLLSFILVFSRWPVVWVETPHKVFVWAQPFVLAILIYFVLFKLGLEGIQLPVAVAVLAFFVTTMVCHGELARDRPDAKHLTEFYLWMSVGGMVGGMFNGLIAPVIFKDVYEFTLAVFIAGLLRPTLPGDWLDKLFSGGTVREENKGLSYGLDIGVPVALLVVLALLSGVFNPYARGVVSASEQSFRLFAVFGIPLVVACAFMMRPLRYGLAIGAILLTHSFVESGAERGYQTVFNDRSYFGVIKIKEAWQSVKPNDDTKELTLPFRQMIHGHIDHGMNFLQPGDEPLSRTGQEARWLTSSARGDPNKDLSRLATTYYHRKGPAGIVMEKFNWFPDQDHENTFWADARMPASLVATAFGGPSMAPLPTEVLVDMWSEPAYSTIGLGTGSMASYSRPFQHMHYYEIDNTVRRLSLPPEGKVRYFNSLQGALQRGSDLQVLMGDARLRMAQPYLTLEEAREKMKVNEADFYAQTPEGRALREKAREMSGGPDDFYHMMVVDAFTSDAIPVHLITKEALEMYFNKLTHDGILCVHTSNRYVDLVPVVADVANSIRIKTKNEEGKDVEVGLIAWRGHDNAPGNERGSGKPIPIDHVGHYTSEWVMVARADAKVKKIGSDGKEKVVHIFDEYLLPPRRYEELCREFFKEPGDGRRNDKYWSVPAATRRHIWTDDYSNLMAVFKGR